MKGKHRFNRSPLGEAGVTGVCLGNFVKNRASYRRPGSYCSTILLDLVAVVSFVLATLAVMQFALFFVLENMDCVVRVFFG